MDHRLQENGNADTVVSSERGTRRLSVPRSPSGMGPASAKFGIANGPGCPPLRLKVAEQPSTPWRLGVSPTTPKPQPVTTRKQQGMPHITRVVVILRSTEHKAAQVVEATHLLLSSARTLEYSSLSINQPRGDQPVGVMEATVPLPQRPKQADLLDGKNQSYHQAFYLQQRPDPWAHLQFLVPSSSNSSKRSNRPSSNKSNSHERNGRR